MSKTNVSSLPEPLEETAFEAGSAIMAIHRSGADAATKSDGSPVTLADRRAEEIILRALARIAPEIQVISEENAKSHQLPPAERFFLVDPLDGTREFIRQDGSGAFTVNIALIEHGSPVLGIVYAPALDRMFSGRTGGGARELCGGKARGIAVRNVPHSGPVAVASRSHRDPETDRWLEDNKVSQTVSIGSSLKFCLLAAGEADIYPRFGPTMEWDTAAGDAVLRAAGGTVTNPDGAPFVYGKPNYRNGSFVAYGDPGVIR